MKTSKILSFLWKHDRQAFSDWLTDNQEELEEIVDKRRPVDDDDEDSEDDDDSEDSEEDDEEDGEYDPYLDDDEDDWDDDDAPEEEWDFSFAQPTALDNHLSDISPLSEPIGTFGAGIH